MLSSLLQGMESVFQLFITCIGNTIREMCIANLVSYLQLGVQGRIGVVAGSKDHIAVVLLGLQTKHKSVIIARHHILNHCHKFGTAVRVIPIILRGRLRYDELVCRGGRGLRIPSNGVLVPRGSNLLHHYGILIITCRSTGIGSIPVGGYSVQTQCRTHYDGIRRYRTQLGKTQKRTYRSTAATDGIPRPILHP